ncbi:MAG: lytic transglycosylase domain-containing protein [Bacillota bacterium]|nr:lytic transglycosylase domain-containing protein [Bacillota bacterium]MDD3298210.1 lytic transglycosylase domain-containing protein [Bacillota bacterium]MDD3850677.1 lytic transglycosylase domain-containing protein [Bacillota bacterium]MDD4707772.1 lytic transglycosylase domain-containing protein [Bacillota bacterium]
MLYLESVFRKRRILITLIITAVLIIVIINSATWLLKVAFPVYHRDLIFRYSGEYDVDPYLIAAIIRSESKFYHKATSHKDARGLMQISPITGMWAAEVLRIADYVPERLYEPEINIMIGCWYVHMLEKEFGSNLENVIAAYNGGSGNVTRWLADKRYSNDGRHLDHIPFGETRKYVEKVLYNYRVYSNLYK